MFEAKCKLCDKEMKSIYGVYDGGSVYYCFDCGTVLITDIVPETNSPTHKYIEEELDWFEPKSDKIVEEFDEEKVLENFKELSKNGIFEKIMKDAYKEK